MSCFRWDGDDLILECHLQPAARSDDFAGLHGDRLKIRLTAPPVEGKANAYLMALSGQGVWGCPRARSVCSAVS